MPRLYRIPAASGSTHFSSPPGGAGHQNASFRERRSAEKMENNWILRIIPASLVGSDSIGQETPPVVLKSRRSS
ncbi:MAG: hypothetical protein HC806_07190 [Anaerolineae bacterium]|nr:hypothetical protein [Anaerolineae bacterium]